MSRWLIAAGDFTTLGGQDRANHALAGFLATHGHEVHLVAHRVAFDLSQRAGVHVEEVARPFSAHLVGAPLLARAASRAARRLGAGGRVLMNGGNGAIGVPTWIHYLHAAYEPEVAASGRTAISASIGRRYYLRREAAALRAAPLVICNSARTAADVERHYHVPAGSIRVIYYGTDPAEFGPASADERRAARFALGVTDDRPIVVFIGALGDRRKGFDLLFEAWRSLSASAEWDALLLAAGAGAERDAWEARARAAGLENVRLLGFRTDIAALLAAADVLVHPARYEAYGLGVHEAVSRGVPAIVTARSGVAERFPSELAPLLLADGGTGGDLAAVLLRWRASAREWRQRIAPVSRALRERTWDHMAAEIAAAVDAA